MSKALRLIGVLAIATVAPATLLSAPHMPIAGAIPPPVIDPNVPPPPDGPPGPETPMQQRNQCAKAWLKVATDPQTVSAAQDLMKLPELWSSAGRGSGVTVAIIDTGVTPSARLPHLRGGGDYVMSGDGLSDCDNSGTPIASIIGGAPAEDDTFSGIAPDAELISIRIESEAFQPITPSSKPRHIWSVPPSANTLARALVHAANLGADIIMIPSTCMPASAIEDQSELAAAVRYAAVDKDAVIVSGAGNFGRDCQPRNPDVQPTNAQDPRNWGGVETVSTPAWFVDHVLAVGAADSNGQTAPYGFDGPWIDVAAPGNSMNAIGADGKLVNGTLGYGYDFTPYAGTSFSAAYVAGLAALIRAKHPDLTAAEVTERIVSTAQNPSGHVDNQWGHGMIDPVAAVGAAPAQHKPGATAVSVVAVTAAAVLLLGAGFWWLRPRRRSAGWSLTGTREPRP